jgi:hypothetical protein
MIQVIISLITLILVCITIYWAYKDRKAQKKRDELFRKVAHNLGA